MHFLPKDKLDAFFTRLSENAALYIPSKDKNGRTKYTKYSPATEDHGATEYSDAVNTERFKILDSVYLAEPWIRTMQTAALTAP